MKSVTLGIMAFLIIALSIRCDKEVFSVNLVSDFKLSSISDGLQLKFETQAISAVMKNTRLITNSVIEQNSKYLSEFSEIMRQRRWSRIKSGVISLVKYLTENILTAEGPTHRKIDTIVGLMSITSDNIPYLRIGDSEIIILNLVVSAQDPELDESVLYIGYFEQMSPVDRRFESIFSVLRTAKVISEVAYIF